MYKLPQLQFLIRHLQQLRDRSKHMSDLKLVNVCNEEFEFNETSP